MKKILAWGTLVLILGAINMSIVRKEKTLTSGQSMLFELAPVDPRSLIQGDYMVLRYAMARQIPESDMKAKGCIVVSLDTNNVASYVRIHGDEALSRQERLVVYRNRGGLRLGAESFLFQEGHADRYAQARYGELRVDKSGQSILVGLRDAKFQILGGEPHPPVRQ